MRSSKKAKGFIYFLCSPSFLRTLKIKKQHRYFIVCAQDEITETVNALPAPKPKNVNIQPSDDSSIVSLGGIVHRGYNWLLENEAIDENIITIVVPTENMTYLMGVFTSGFLKIPVDVRVVSPPKTLKLQVVQDFTPMELESAIRSFNKEDFIHAKFVFQGIKRRSRLIANRHIFSTLTKLCDFYINWDDFNYNAARGILKEIYSELEDLERQIRYFTNIRISLQENEKFLDKLNIVFLSAGKRSESIREMHEFLYLLLDILLRGKRLAKLGKHYDACVRFYRVLEGIIQHRLLKEYGFNVQKPNYDELSRRLSLSKEVLCKILGLETLPSHLAFNEGFLVLKSCNDAFVKKIDQRLVQSLQYARNNSLLVHGIIPLKEETVAKLWAFSERTLKELFIMSKLNFEAHCSQAMPCTLNASMLEF